jgi:beta-barrel assembly-enhancing protease
MTLRLSTHRYVLCVAFVLGLAAAFPAAQTKVALDNNRYSTADDVKLGQQAAAEIRKELPMLRDSQVDDWVADIGRKLEAAIPPEFDHDGFRYTFEVVNQREINAFALPGGPMFLNRGMIEAATSEAEVAGVMAHEISHVALRHGTAQATKGQRFQLGALLGQVAGAVIGGTAGSVIANAVPAGLGTYFLRYGREYEREADLLGAQLLARAGYDPRQMANMFRTIESEGGGRGPEWLSSHPNPGNRYEAINREAAMLRIEGNADTGRFPAIKARLQGMPPAPTAEEIAKRQSSSGNAPANAPSAGSTARVQPPSSQYRTHQPSSALRLSVPSNWSPVDRRGSGATYAPDGAFHQSRSGQTAFTHGVQIGVGDGSGNLQRDTEQLLSAFARTNPQLRQQGGFRREQLGGRSGLTTSLLNVSEVTGQRETITLSTTHMPNGSLLYLISVVPQGESRTYDAAFRRIRQSVQIAR